MKNRVVGSRLTIIGTKSSDLVMNLAHQRYSLIVHTKRLCSEVASEASWWRWHLRWSSEEVGDRCRMEGGPGSAESPLELGGLRPRLPAPDLALVSQGF